jgi:polyisoprenoid-binding protein YceI
MSIKTLMALTALATMASHALADNAALVNKAVRVQVSGVGGGGQISGKLTNLDGCLYVNFNKPTKDGLRSVRLDQVQSLQVFDNGGWMGRSIKALLKQEPQKCFAEANG